MGTTAVALGFPFSNSTLKGPAAKRQRCEVLRGQLELERQSFIPVWQNCNDFILPQRARFQVTDVNKGNRRNLNIIDSTGSLAARVCQAGMVAGITSPARPWFELSTPDERLAEQDDVKKWLHETADVLRGIFLRSNFYNEIPTLFGDIGTFGTGAMMVLEDDEDVIRCYDFPVGTYAVGNDARRQVRIFSRVFRRTVSQVVEQWGQIDERTGKPNFMDGRASTISLNVQNLWQQGTTQAWIDLVHVIQPNLSYDGEKIDSKYKRFESVYYEYGMNGNAFPTTGLGLLSHEGFDEFPVLVARWETSGEDVYGTNWPGLMALGDVKMLQTMAKRGSQALDKWVNPPMTGPANLRTAAASLLPGNITYADVGQGQLGFRPVHELSQMGPAIQSLREEKAEAQNRIKECYFVNLFLMLEQSDRREYTATEIMERKEEKLLVVGPVLEQVSQDVLDPVIARTFNAAYRRGMIPPAPESLAGQRLVPVYVSVMAQAQRQTGIASMERFTGFLGQFAQIEAAPSPLLDNVDADKFVQEYADAVGVTPEILRSADDVAKIRQDRATAQQQAMAAENAPKVADAAKTMSETQLGGPTALNALMQSAAAKRTIGATARPLA